jgi:FkbM family methyltransferase
MSAFSKITNQIRKTGNFLLGHATRLAETHPIVWKLAWEAVHRFTFLLPHDQSYKAFRHFIALRPQGLFLDVGANDGISVLSFRKFDKKYRILGLEPNPALETALRRIRSADPLFEYRMVGAGASPVQLQFFVPIYRKIVLHTFTSSSREQVLQSVQQSFGDSVAAITSISSFQAEIIRLDDLDIDPSIIKIDAEGFDYDVLKGLEKTIKRSRAFIATEISSPEFERIKTYMDGLHYVLLSYDVGNDRFSKELGSYSASSPATSGHRNIFAVPEEKLAALPVELLRS